MSGHSQYDNSHTATKARRQAVDIPAIPPPTGTDSSKKK